MFSKKIFWKFAVGALVLPCFLGLEVASASIAKKVDKQSQQQEIDRSLFQLSETSEVEDLSLEVEPQVDNEDLEQTKSNYHYKHHHHKKKKRYYNKYKRPCRTYYRPKKVHHYKGRSRNHYHKNVHYQHRPKKHHNHYYGY